MPHKIRASSHRIPVTNLSPATFAPFGEVTQNPRTHNGEPALQTVEANQGSATKWLDVAHMENYYPLGTSKKEAKCVMNMFVCRPRQLKGEGGRLFGVEVLERHPYTPQTFVPMGLGKEDKETAYLVIVAPTLPSAAWGSNKALAKPGKEALEAYEFELRCEGRDRTMAREQAHLSAAPSAFKQPMPKLSGPPDLANLRAFIARGDQAVTYGQGTWHAPMVVLGEREMEFLVVQFANGVGDEDCQEVEFVFDDKAGGIEVDVGSGFGGEVKAKAEEVEGKAKL